ncbi:MAG: PilN domain-containing protein [Candidatus Methylomirabilales bacterium]
MDITLNLVSPEIQKRRRLRHLAVGGLCLSLLLGLGNFFLYRSSRADLRIAEQRRERYQQAVQKREDTLATLTRGLAAHKVEHLDDRVKLYNGIIQGAAFSWSHLLFELERAIPANVALVEIQPNFVEGDIILAGTAKTMEDVLRCVRSLKDRDAFYQVYLLKHEVKKDRTGGSGMQFSISLHYRGEAA